MAPKKQKQKNKKKSSSSNNDSTSGELIDVDPSRIRFQHSRIRPHFSGCGRSVISTLEAIRNGDITISEIPPIQVIVGPDENDGKGPWYFSLNNRRLWVFKRCREEGLLPNNVISVRVRQPKSIAELERYSITNCAVEAKFMREKENKSEQAQTADKTVDSTIKQHIDESIIKSIENIKIETNQSILVMNDDKDEDDDDENTLSSASDVSQQPRNQNRFCFDNDSSDESDDNSD